MTVDWLCVGEGPLCRCLFCEMVSHSTVFFSLKAGDNLDFSCHQQFPWDWPKRTSCYFTFWLWPVALKTGHKYTLRVCVNSFLKLLFLANVTETGVNRPFVWDYFQQRIHPHLVLCVCEIYLKKLHSLYSRWWGNMSHPGQQCGSLMSWIVIGQHASCIVSGLSCFLTGSVVGFGLFMGL